MKSKISNFLIKLRRNVVEYVISNRLFLSYLILSIVGTLFVRLFTINSFFSLKPFLTDLGLILVIGAFGYFVKPKNQFKYYFTWLIIFTAINVISSIYYSFFTDFASFGSLETVGQVKTVTGSIFDKLRFVDLMYIIVPITFYLIHRRLTHSTYYYFIDKVEKGKKMVASTIIVGTLCLGYSFGVATGTDYSRLAKQWNRVYIVERFGILTYQLNDIIQSITPKLSGLFGYDEAKEKFDEYFDAKPEHENNKYTNILDGKNIIFVHMESVQSFLMDLEFNGEEVTPNVNKLAQEGMYFSNFYPQVSTGTSSDTEFTLLTGLMPASSGTVFVSYYDREYFTIPKYLKTKDYYIFSSHGNKAAMWNRFNAHPSLGYDDMFFEESFTFRTPEDVINLGINDELFFEQELKILENIEETHNNYMGTVITLSNHSPFKEAAKYSELDLSTTYTKKDPETGEVITEVSNYLTDTAVGEYIRSANYGDKALKVFLDGIKNSDKFNDTVFVFYGDHDARLSRSEINMLYNLNPENGSVYEETDPKYTNYDYYEHELNKKTPLIIWTKNKDLQRIFKGEVTYTMGMYDVSTTILNMYGLNNKYSMGSDIFNTKDDNVVIFPNGNFLTKRIYYNNSTGEYKKLNEKDVITEEYIENIREETERKLEVSNSIIVHDLLKDIKVNGE